MPSEVPFDRLVAEVAWWPLGSELAFERCTTEVSREAIGVLDESTAGLAAGLEEHLRTRASGASLEVLRQIRDSVWFSPEPDHRPFNGTQRAVSASSLVSGDRKAVGLHTFLMGLARERIYLDGGMVRLQSDPDIRGSGGAGVSGGSGARPELPLCEATGSWRWLSFALPPDLLIAARAAELGKEPPADHVSLGIAPLERFLQDEKIAELHLHVGAAPTFEWLWTNLVSRIGNDEDAYKIRDGDSFLFGSGKAFLAWLSVAALVRVTLAAFLWRRDCGARESFSAFCGEEGRLSPERLVEHQQIIRALITGQAPPPEALVRSLFRRYSGVRTGLPAPDTAREIRGGDPLATWLGDRSSALPETRFLARAISYLNGPYLKDEDSLFARVFWQYVRLRCLTYRHLTQEPGTAGLDWFQVHYKRISSLSAGLGLRARVGLALDLESRGARLGSLEVRTAPPEHWHEVRNMVLAVVNARGSAVPGSETSPERGLVLHFIKEAEVPGRPIRQRRLHADPDSTVVHGCRYGVYYYKRLRQALAVVGALRHNPELLLVLRGMDVCSIELAVPTWVILPLILRVREESREAAARIASSGMQVPPIQVTLHAGEDYRHLAEGLRRIHEPVEYGLLRDGGRLGHAVALGVDPERWAKTSPVTVQPSEERLDDLLWEMARYRRAELRSDPDRVEYVRGEIERLGKQIYCQGHGEHKEPPPLADLLEARNLRHCPRALERMGYPFMSRGLPPPRRGPNDIAYRCLYRYLTSPDVFRRGQEPVRVRVDDAECRMLREAQRFIRSRLARLGVTIEANPSSNLLIADLQDMEDHPIYRLQPLPGYQAPEGGIVQVALGDDDPVTFATCLPEEFTHLFFALVRRGVAVQDALGWLERLRENGWRARFTLPLSADGRYQKWVAGKGMGAVFLPTEGLRPSERRASMDGGWYGERG